MSHLQIRRAAGGDAALLAELAARLFRATYEPHNRREDVDAYVAEHFGPEQQAAELADAGTVTLVARSADEPVGYAQLRLGRDVPCDRRVAPEHAAEIARFYVDPAWHGQGVAPALMQSLLAAAVGSQIHALWLGVWKKNTRAVAFYRKQGFEVCGEQEFRMGSDVQSDHVMVRTLPAVALLLE